MKLNQFQQRKKSVDVKSKWDWSNSRQKEKPVDVKS